MAINLSPVITKTTEVQIDVEDCPTVQFIAEAAAKNNVPAEATVYADHTTLTFSWEETK